MRDDDAMYHIGFRGESHRQESALEEHVRQLLQQHMGMLRLQMTPIEYVAFKLRITYERAEAIVARLKEDDE